MKIRYLFSVVFGLLGAALAALTVYLCLEYRDASPVLLETPQGAESCISAAFDAICAGDYAEAEKMIYGTPSFGVDTEPADAVGSLIWDAFQESLSYELIGMFHATDDGLARDVQFTCLDISSVTVNLRERSQKLLTQWVAEAEDPSVIYDEDNEYREELVMQALYEATVQALAEDAGNITLTFTVNMIFRDGQWWVVSDKELLRAVSGGIIS